MFWIQGRCIDLGKSYPMQSTGAMSMYRAIINFHGNMLHTLYQEQLDAWLKEQKSLYMTQIPGTML